MQPSKGIQPVLPYTGSYCAECLEPTKRPRIQVHSAAPKNPRGHDVAHVATSDYNKVRDEVSSNVQVKYWPNTARA